MIKILIIITSIMLAGISYAYEDIYETKFYKVNINDEIIIDAKNREIDLIISTSFFNVLKKILTEENFKKFKRKIDNIKETPYLIKNIIIEDEFISENKYSSKVKINFINNEIINLLRDYKINYTDFSSSNILIISAENKNFILSGLSEDNNFYKLKKINNYGLINLKYPDLSPNDRYLLPYDKIIQKNLKSLKKISIKYNVDYVYIIYLNEINSFNNVDLSIYSSSKNKIIKEIYHQNIKDYEYQEKILFYLDDWWKNYNIIDNSILNRNICSIKNSNIHELYFIKSAINSISQVKSLTLSKVSLGLNSYDFIFYGSLSNLYLKLLKIKIKIEINSNQNCIISIFN